MSKKVKIVCTLGPASLKKDVLSQMVDAGLNVARLNFSHGTHEGHSQALALVREVAAEKQAYVSVMLDTKGPEIRTTMVSESGQILQNGSRVILSPDDGLPCTAQQIRLTHATLAQECKVGQDVYIDDGTIHLKVQAVRGDQLDCQVVVGGELKNQKGVNAPGARLSLPAMSEKDRADILWGVENNVDFIAISFVRSRDDVLAVRKVIEQANGNIKLIAKIESRQAVDCLEEIADVVDGMMIARGDLGVEIPTEDVPLVQKRIIDLCRRRGKMTIVATQMLDSMIRNPRPTRAEANDVAGGVLDGADAVMLSGESAAGQYPVLAVQTMAKIARRAEESLDLWGRKIVDYDGEGVPEGVAKSAVTLALATKAKAILCLTTSGVTAQLVSKYRPACLILGVSPDEKTCREMSLLWGVHPLHSQVLLDSESAIKQALREGVNAAYLQPGDLVVITAGFPMDVPGTTNALQVRIVSSVVDHGLSVKSGIVTARACVCKSAEDLHLFQEGDVLITYDVDRDFVTTLRKASALIVVEGGLTCHGAILALEFGLPAIVNAREVMNKVKTGDIITVDAGRGFIYEGPVNLGQKEQQMIKV